MVLLVGTGVGADVVLERAEQFLAEGLGEIGVVGHGAAVIHCLGIWVDSFSSRTGTGLLSIMGRVSLESVGTSSQSPLSGWSVEPSNVFVS